MRLYLSIVRVALSSIWANKLRSLLTMLGIIIGVGSVIAMLSLGEGAEKAILDSIRSFGTNRLMVRPGARGGSQGVNSDRIEPLKVQDATQLFQRVQWLDAVAPEVRGSVVAKFGRRSSRVSIIGTSNTYFDIYNFEIEHGRSFTEAEERQNRRVCVLGPQTVENLFGAFDAQTIGSTIKINGTGYRVIGVTLEKGDAGWFNPDNQIYMPYTTAMKRVLGTDNLSLITAHVANEDEIPAAEEEMRRALRAIRKVPAEKKDDFILMNSAEFLRELQKFSTIFRSLLAGIAGISLLVGGIGIMNIMLVTVTERTREIGIRKALGAKNRAILFQFVIEAITVCVVGGILGILSGSGLVFLFNFATRNMESIFTAFVSPEAVLLGLAFSVGTGLIFGIYPAHKASRLDPIDALRYE